MYPLRFSAPIVVTAQYEMWVEVTCALAVSGRVVQRVDTREICSFFLHHTSVIQQYEKLFSTFWINYVSLSLVAPLSLFETARISGIKSENK
jgi:hypothetical protein